MRLRVHKSSGPFKYLEAIGIAVLSRRVELCQTPVYQPLLSLLVRHLSGHWEVSHSQAQFPCWVVIQNLKYFIHIKPDITVCLDPVKLLKIYIIDIDIFKYQSQCLDTEYFTVSINLTIFHRRVLQNLKLSFYFLCLHWLQTIYNHSLVMLMTSDTSLDQVF